MCRAGVPAEVLRGAGGDAALRRGRRDLRPPHPRRHLPRLLHPGACLGLALASIPKQPERRGVPCCAVISEVCGHRIAAGTCLAGSIQGRSKARFVSLEGGVDLGALRTPRFGGHPIHPLRTRRHSPVLNCQTVISLRRPRQGTPAGQCTVAIQGKIVLCLSWYCSGDEYCPFAQT